MAPRDLLLLHNMRFPTPSLCQATASPFEDAAAEEPPRHVKGDWGAELEPHLWGERQPAGVEPDEPLRSGDNFYHSVQDREEIDVIESRERPPMGYCDPLADGLWAKFLQTDEDMVDQAVVLVAAFDTATAYAMSFGIVQGDNSQEHSEWVAAVLSMAICGSATTTAVAGAVPSEQPLDGMAYSPDCLTLLKHLKVPTFVLKVRLVTAGVVPLLYHTSTAPVVRRSKAIAACASKSPVATLCVLGYFGHVPRRAEETMPSMMLDCANGLSTESSGSRHMALAFTSHASTLAPTSPDLAETTPRTQMATGSDASNKHLARLSNLV